MDQGGKWYFYRTSPDVASGDYRLDVRVDLIDPFEFPTHLIQFQYAYDLAGNSRCPRLIRERVRRSVGVSSC